MFPGEKDAGFSVDYVEFEVNVRDASEKLRILLLAMPCFECYALVISNCYSLFLTCTLLCHTSKSFLLLLSLIGMPFPPLFL